MNNNVIIFSNLSYRYSTQNPWVLLNYNAKIRRGSVFSILGENGCGKTTLLKLLLHIFTPDSGYCYVNGLQAFAPQLFRTQFPYKVLDVVLMGRARSIGLFSLPDRNDRDIAYESLARLGLEKLAFRSFDELSGGQRQLVIFARALASGADILILDEPTSALDLKNQQLVLKWMKKLSQDEGLTIIFTTHSPQHALAISDESLLMLGAEKYIAGNSQQILTEMNLFQLYGVLLRQVEFMHEKTTINSIVPIYKI
ncbi:ABC transporter ATP-binding protein [Escherichia albertii]|nr:ABC transporter ATP-binding protein [Escherichia albertii]